MAGLIEDLNTGVYNLQRLLAFLGRCDITEEDITTLERYPGGLTALAAEMVTKAFKLGPKLLINALGNDEESAIRAVNQIGSMNDRGMLATILKSATLEVARTQVISVVTHEAVVTNFDKATRVEILMEIVAGKYPCERQTRAMAARKLDDRDLQVLVALGDNEIANYVLIERARETI